MKAKYDELCSTCGKSYGRHEANTLHCPMFMSPGFSQVVSFHPSGLSKDDPHGTAIKEPAAEAPKSARIDRSEVWLRAWCAAAQRHWPADSVDWADACLKAFNERFPDKT